MTRPFIPDDALEAACRAAVSVEWANRYPTQIADVQWQAIWSDFWTQRRMTAWLGFLSAVCAAVPAYERARLDGLDMLYTQAQCDIAPGWVCVPESEWDSVVGRMLPAPVTA